MLWTVAIAVALYAALAAAVTLGQRRILFLPNSARPDAAAAAVPGLREVTLHTADGLDLLAWWLPPARPEAPTLAYFHGNGGNLANRIPRLRAFAQLGWGVLMPEYRGYGGNPGGPSETGFAADAVVAMAFLDAQGIPQARTVIYGESIGTGVAVPLAAGRGIAALVLESPFTSITDLARARFPWLPVRLLLRDPFDSLARIAEVRVPLLVLQGSRDDIVPPARGQALLAAANPPKQLWTAPEAGHNDLMQHGALDAVAAFLRPLVPGASLRSP